MNKWRIKPPRRIFSPALGDSYGADIYLRNRLWGFEGLAWLLFVLDHQTGGRL